MSNTINRIFSALLTSGLSATRRAAMLLLATMLCAMGAQADDYSTPLTLEFPSGGTVTIKNPKSLTIKYSIDGGNTKTASSANPITITVSAGQTVQLYGNGTTNKTYGGSDQNSSTNISCSADCYVYGNIMSLVDETDFATNVTLTASSTFHNLFRDNTHLKNHNSKKLLLPATTLTSLCYYHMFQGCTGLTTAPDLPATTLTAYCYCDMFLGCSNLNYVKCMATDISATWCTVDWLENVASSGTFEKALGSSWGSGDGGIPSGWSASYPNTTYTIQFNNNGGSGQMANQTFTYAVAQDLSANAFTAPTDKFFAGWNTESDGSGTSYYNQQSVAGLSAVENAVITLYAQWVDIIYVPLTLEFLQTTNLKISNPRYLKVTLSTNGGKKESYLATYSILEKTYSAGQTVQIYFAATSSTFNSDGSLDNSTRISCSADCYVYGNIMSLVDKENFATKTTLTAENTLQYLFKDNTHLKNHPDAAKKLLLPATTLTPNAYANMFSGCTGLTTAPELPATTLAEGCYSNMFSGCTNLNYVKCLATNLTANNCTSEWLTGVASSGNFVKAGNTIWTTESTSGIPSGWTISYNDAPTTYTFIFNANGGTGTMENQQFTYDVAQNLTANTFTAPEGKVFVGWNTESDGSGTSYSDQQRILGLTTENGAIIKLYAQWVDKYAIPLTLEFPSNGSGGTVTITNKKGLTMHYAIDGGAKQQIGGNTNDITITVTAGQTVQLYGNGTTNTAYSGYYESSSTKINCSADCYVYGNIMSLVDEIGFATNKKLTGTYALSYLFKDNTHLKNHTDAAKTLLLPATTLADYCYSYMFSGCTGLTTAPALPATTLAEWCYESMFNGCTGLTTAPALPATTLAEACYYEMFSGCTYLTTAPELPATTLAENCYNSMFDGCSSLTTAPDLPATTLAANCYNNMFSGCSSLTNAPELPATTLAEGCYCNMFFSCSNLNYVKCMATDISAKNCTGAWLLSVDYSGTFVKVKGVSWDRGDSGIPEDWTVVEAEATHYGAITTYDYDDDIKEAFIDGTSTEAVSIPADITVNRVTFNRTFTAGKPATLMLPFSIATSNVSGAAFYTFGGVSYNETEQKWIATMNAVSSALTANTPYLVMPSATGQITFTIPESGVTFNTTGGGGQETVKGNWTFRGTYEYIKWTSNQEDADYSTQHDSEIGKVFCFEGVENSDTKVGDFVTVVDGTGIRPMNCYLAYTGTEELPDSFVVRLRSDDGIATDLNEALRGVNEELRMKNEESVWYDLQGRKLNGKPTKKGIYIVNGRKVLF